MKFITYLKYRIHAEIHLNHPNNVEHLMNCFFFVRYLRGFNHLPSQRNVRLIHSRLWQRYSSLKYSHGWVLFSRKEIRDFFFACEIIRLTRTKSCENNFKSKATYISTIRSTNIFHWHQSIWKYHLRKMSSNYPCWWDHIEFLFFS